MTNSLCRLTVALLAMAAAAGIATPVHGQASGLPPVHDLPGLDRPPPPQPPMPVTPGGACAGEVHVDDGVVTLEFRNPARANQRLNYRIAGLTFSTRFDANGAVQARAPLLRESGVLEWDEGRPEWCPRPVVFPNFASAMLTALVWEGPIDLGLHVIEPGGRRANLSPVQGAASQSLASQSAGSSFGEPGGGGSHVLLYSVPREWRTAVMTFFFRVEFASRGNPARPPYCGSSTTAVAGYRLQHLSGGKLSTKSGEFDSVPCGQAWSQSEDAFSFPWRWVP